jgi:hypothetical protein
MDIGLWSLGGIAIGSAATIIGIDWTLGASAAICAIAATTLLFANRRHPPKAPDNRLLIAGESEIRAGE